MPCSICGEMDWVRTLLLTDCSREKQAWSGGWGGQVSGRTVCAVSNNGPGKGGNWASDLKKSGCSPKASEARLRVSWGGVNVVWDV